MASMFIRNRSKAGCRFKPEAVNAILAGSVAILISALPAPIHAQEYGIPPTVLRRSELPDHALLLLQEVNRPALLTMVDGSTLKGKIGWVDASEITLLLDDSSLMEARVGVSWARISEVRVERKSRILEGMLLGGVGGALVGSLSHHDSSLRKEILGINAPEQTWEAITQGALIGSVLGLLNGFDVVLPHARQSFGLQGPLYQSAKQVRPTIRIVNTAPVRSQTYNDIEESLQASPLSTGISMHAEQTWTGRTGSSIALETSWPGERRLWVRSRLEWTTLSRIGIPEREWSAGEGPIDLWREYSAIRSFLGFALPFGPVDRLPFAEVVILAGISRTAIRSGVVYEGTVMFDPFEAGSKQKVYRPLLMASGSIALVRRPKLAISLRAEGIFGPGFNANALFNDLSEEIIPRHRITPIGFSAGIELLLPNF